MRSPVGGRKRSEAEALKEAAKLIKGCDPKLVEAIMQEVCFTLHTVLDIG